jgi:hypothetical protein
MSVDIPEDIPADKPMTQEQKDALAIMVALAKRTAKTKESYRELVGMINAIKVLTFDDEQILNRTGFHICKDCKEKSLNRAKDRLKELGIEV